MSFPSVFPLSGNLPGDLRGGARTRRKFLYIICSVFSTSDPLSACFTEKLSSLSGCHRDLLEIKQLLVALRAQHAGSAKFEQLLGSLDGRVGKNEPTDSVDTLVTIALKISEKFRDDFDVVRQLEANPTAFRCRNLCRFFIKIFTPKVTRVHTHSFGRF